MQFRNENEKRKELESYVACIAIIVTTMPGQNISLF